MGISFLIYNLKFKIYNSKKHQLFGYFIVILLIVESPTKVKTIEKFLGKEYKVISSYGHICNLSKKKNSVEIINDKVQLDYELLEKADKIIANLKKEAKKASLILLATDNDREGEAIAWHLHNFLGLEKLNKEKKIECQRIIFNEISEKAIKKAIENPSKINMDLVNAQQVRRVLDRLVGFKLSPFLWKKIIRGLSAGRVQSAALKIIVNREKEIQNFKPEEYWKIEAILQTHHNQEFKSLLVKKNNEKIKTITKEITDEILENLKKSKWQVSEIKKSIIKKTAPPPFITSTLQQEASQKLGYSIKKTMTIAQKLYEEGYITYHRTDSFNLNANIIKEAQLFIEKKYGKEYSDKKTKIYKKRKNTQEAHEAIRPVNLSKKKIGENEFLYKLIKNRFLASQMSDSLFNSINIEIVAAYKKNFYTFNTKELTSKFDGFLKLYQDKEKIKEKILPELTNNEILKLKKLLSEQCFTKPLIRYTEASLVKELEKNGIGRPSTYSPIISTIQDRNYVFKNEDKKLEPTDIGVLVSNFLEIHFSDIVNLNFTAKIEDKLDQIAENKLDWEKTIIDFYNPFIKHLKLKEGEIDKKDIINLEKTEEKCDKCGAIMIIKIGRFGKFIACSNYPECKNTKPIKKQDNKKIKTENQIIINKRDAICEKCHSKMIIKEGRFGKFLGCSNYPNCKNIKSILKKIDVKCPLCEKGDLIEKNTKTKRIFYGCSNYPICDFALWQKPINERCYKCNSLLIEIKKGTKCSNKDCNSQL